MNHPCRVRRTSPGWTPSVPRGCFDPSNTARKNRAATLPSRTGLGHVPSERCATVCANDVDVVPPPPLGRIASSATRVADVDCANIFANIESACRVVTTYSAPGKGVVIVVGLLRR